MVSTLIGESVANQLKNISLSNNTISRRIQDISDNINDQLIDKLRNKNFAIQLDEAIDNNKDAYLICYVRFVDRVDIIKELLFCKSILSGTKAEDLFDITNNFIDHNNIKWENCLGVCTDGARAMSASQNISCSLNNVLEIVIKVVNYVKTRLVKERFFQKLCEEMGAEHTTLLFYCNSRRLSKGNVLSKVFELRQELYSYLNGDGYNNSKMFVDSDFVIKLAYLCDIFEKLNSPNISLQEENGKTTCFPLLKYFLGENDLELPMSLKTIFLEHLTNLETHFMKYFPEEMKQYYWIKDPFTEKPPSNFTTTEEEQLIDISSDFSLRMQFSSYSLLGFWNSIKDEYPEVSNKALRILIPFATSYLCEVRFSAVAVSKSKYRSKLNAEKEMCVAVTTLIPNFEKLINEK
ncbi:hypothetical protein QTP88_018055 [Uroleucon formosanum]